MTYIKALQRSENIRPFPDYKFLRDRVFVRNKRRPDTSEVVGVQVSQPQCRVHSFKGIAATRGSRARTKIR